VPTELEPLERVDEEGIAIEVPFALHLEPLLDHFLIQERELDAQKRKSGSQANGRNRAEETPGGSQRCP
jgi:hypothetical protein